VRREQEVEEGLGATQEDSLQHWQALSEQERKHWEDRAAEEQRRYLQDCVEAAVADLESGNGGDGEAGEREEDLALQLPMSRITRVLRNNRDIGKIERGAIFTIAKATESFLERCVWDAARVTSRSHRKTIALRDLITSMHEHTNPESVQVFLGAHRPSTRAPRRYLLRPTAPPRADEFQTPRAEPAKPAKRASGAKRSGRPSGGGKKAKA